MYVVIISIVGSCYLYGDGGFGGGGSSAVGRFRRLKVISFFMVIKLCLCCCYRYLCTAIYISSPVYTL